MFCPPPFSTKISGKDILTTVLRKLFRDLFYYHVIDDMQNINNDFAISYFLKVYL